MSSSASTPTRMRLRPWWWWPTVSAIALAVYVSGAVFSLAAASLYAGLMRDASPSCSQITFGPPSPTPRVTP